MMDMLTPIPIATANSHEQLPMSHNVFFCNFSELKSTLGTALRMTADICSIWVAFLFGWLVVDGNPATDLITGRSAGIALSIGLLTIVALTAYISVGLYTRTRRYDLLTKICLIAAVNLVLLMIAAAGHTMVAAPFGLSFHALATTLVGSVILLSLARAGSAVLRREDGRGTGAEQNEETNDNNVLVIGGAGYIGSALVEKLLDLGLHVSILDAMHFGEEALSRVAGHPNLVLIREDFRHIEALTRAVSEVGSAP